DLRAVAAADLHHGPLHPTAQLRGTRAPWPEEEPAQPRQGQHCDADHRDVGGRHDHLPSRGPNASLLPIPLGGKKRPAPGATPFSPYKRRAVAAGERWLAAGPPRPATGWPTGPVRRAGGPRPLYGGRHHVLTVGYSAGQYHESNHRLYRGALAGWTA